MSSTLVYHQNSMNKSPNQQHHEMSLNSLEILQSPVQRIVTMTKTETDIVNMLKESLSLQYDSFEFKHKTFNELLNALKTKREKDQIELLQTFGIYENQAKNEKVKLHSIPEPISEKNESNSYDDSIKYESNQSNVKVEPVQGTERKKRGKKPLNPIEKTQKKEANKQIVENKNKQQKEYESDVGSDEEYEEKKQKKVEAKKANRGPRKNHFILEAKGPNRYEQARKQLIHVMQNKGKILNHYNRVGQILLHPYSTVQMLIDYNESADYPLVKMMNQQVAEDSD